MLSFANAFRNSGTAKRPPSPRIRSNSQQSSNDEDALDMDDTLVPGLEEDYQFDAFLEMRVCLFYRLQYECRQKCFCRYCTAVFAVVLRNKQLQQLAFLKSDTIPKINS